MKILKPGKVEQVKLSCPRCGCVFVVSKRTEMSLNCATKKWRAYCPQRGCEHDFELCEEEMTCYEEPTQCDFCASLIGGKKELMYDGRKTKYCPFCGRKFKEAKHD